MLNWFDYERVELSTSATYNEYTSYAIVAVRMPEINTFSDEDEKDLFDHHLSTLEAYFIETTKHTNIPLLRLNEDVNNIEVKTFRNMSYAPAPKSWVVGLINDDDFGSVEKLMSYDVHAGAVVGSDGGFSIENLRVAVSFGLDVAALNALLYFEIDPTLTDDAQLSLFIRRFGQTILDLIGSPDGLPGFDD